MASRKQRVDSITAQVEIMAKAARAIEPPEHLPLTDKCLAFWDTVIAEKPKSEWTAHDLEIAALLAMSMRKLGEQEVELDTEGMVVTTTGGNMAQNPRVRVVADLAARVVKYRQTLGIHNRAKHGEARDVKKRREQTFAVERDNPMASDLIGKPTVQ